MDAVTCLSRDSLDQSQLTKKTKRIQKNSKEIQKKLKRNPNGKWQTARPACSLDQQNSNNLEKSATAAGCVQASSFVNLVMTRLKLYILLDLDYNSFILL